MDEDERASLELEALAALAPAAFRPSRATVKCDCECRYQEDKRRMIPLWECLIWVVMAFICGILTGGGWRRS